MVAAVPYHGSAAPNGAAGDSSAAGIRTAMPAVPNPLPRCYYSNPFLKMLGSPMVRVNVVDTWFSGLFWSLTITVT